MRKDRPNAQAWRTDGNEGREGSGGRLTGMDMTILDFLIPSLPWRGQQGALKARVTQADPFADMEAATVHRHFSFKNTLEMKSAEWWWRAIMIYKANRVKGAEEKMAFYFWVQRGRGLCFEHRAQRGQVEDHWLVELQQMTCNPVRGSQAGAPSANQIIHLERPVHWEALWSACSPPYWCNKSHILSMLSVSEINTIVA